MDLQHNTIKTKVNKAKQQQQQQQILLQKRQQDPARFLVDFCSTRSEEISISWTGDNSVHAQSTAGKTVDR